MNHQVAWSFLISSAIVDDRYTTHECNENAQYSAEIPVGIQIGDFELIAILEWSRE